MLMVTIFRINLKTALVSMGTVRDNNNFMHYSMLMGTVIKEIRKHSQNIKRYTSFGNEVKAWSGGIDSCFRNGIKLILIKYIFFPRESYWDVQIHIFWVCKCTGASIILLITCNVIFAWYVTFNDASCCGGCQIWTFLVLFRKLLWWGFLCYGVVIWCVYLFMWFTGTQICRMIWRVTLVWQCGLWGHCMPCVFLTQYALKIILNGDFNIQNLPQVSCGGCV